MSLEINTSSKLSFDKNGASATNKTTTKAITMQSTLTHGLQGVVSYAAGVKTAIPVTGVDTTKQYLVQLRNLDVTNYVEVTTDDGATYPCVMLPGESYGPVRLAANAVVKVRAHTAACDVDSIAVEAGDPTL